MTRCDLKSPQPIGCVRKGRCTISNVAESSTNTEKSPSLTFALAAAELAHNTRCEDVVLLDLRERSPVTEFFVLATGTSPRQMRTVVEELRDLGKKMKFSAWQTSGLETGRWILLDCVTVVCHVFDADSRDFYDLELLWGDCPRIDWRKELGLPEIPESERQATAAQRFRQAAGSDEMEAEEEDARLSGDDVDDEEGDADIDEDADSDAPVVVELPDLSTGSNSVEFVEVDPPAKRRKRGRAVYPTPIADEDAMDDDQGMHVVSQRAGAEQSLDEDDQERQSELAADTDVEASSDEDLPEDKIQSRPMGGVSASLSSTSIGDPGEEDQEGSHGAIEDAEQDHKDEIPEAHEEAAETTTIRKRTADGDRIDLSTEGTRRNRKRVLKNRASMAKPTRSAPTKVNLKKAKAGVVKTKKAAPKKAAPKKAATKTAAKKKPAPRAKAVLTKKKATAKKKPAAKKKK